MSKLWVYNLQPAQCVVWRLWQAVARWVIVHSGRARGGWPWVGRYGSSRERDAFRIERGILRFGQPICHRAKQTLERLFGF